MKGQRIGGFGQKFPSDCGLQQLFQRICGSNIFNGFGNWQKYRVRIADSARNFNR